MITVFLISNILNTKTQPPFIAKLPVALQINKPIAGSFLFSIGFRNYEVNELSQTYSDVGDGIKLALFNTMGNLEIAINRGVEGYGGSASQLLGLKEDEIVTVTFNK